MPRIQTYAEFNSMLEEFENEKIVYEDEEISSSEFVFSFLETDYSVISGIGGPRTGTPAASMEDPTPKEEKSRRFDRLCNVQNEISVKIHEAYVGKTLRCLVDGRDKDLLTARTEGGRLVRFAGCDELIGTYRNLHITGCTTWSLTGELK